MINPLARYILAFKKYKQYRSICKKLNNNIEIWVAFMYWGLANKDIDRLNRVKTIWKGE